MKSLIRAAELGAARTRLSERRPAPASTPPALPPSDRELMRRQVEAELATEREREYEKAHADGYADGLAEAKQAVAEQVATTQRQLKEQFEIALSSLQKAHSATLTKLEASVGEVAFAAVCRVIRRKAVTEDFVLGIVEQACAQLRTESVATARLHPRDLRILEDLLQEEGELKVRSLALRLIPDESLQLGGCIVEAASGQYDGGLEQQLRRLHAALTGPVSAEKPIAALRPRAAEG